MYAAISRASRCNCQEAFRGFRKLELTVLLGGLLGQFFVDWLLGGAAVVVDRTLWGGHDRRQRVRVQGFVRGPCRRPALCRFLFPGSPRSAGQGNVECRRRFLRVVAGFGAVSYP